MMSSAIRPVAAVFPGIGSASVRRWCDALAAATLIAVAILALATFRDYGLGWDDYTHAQYGDLLASYYASGLRDRRALSFVNLYMYGGIFDLAGAVLAKILPFDLFETRRLLGAAVGLIGLAATWRVARRLAGAPAGLAAVLLLAACPLYYGHMFINPKDAPFATAMAVLLCALMRVAGEYPRLSWKTGALLAIGFGFSIGLRVMGGLGLLYAFAGLALMLGSDIRADGARMAVARARRFFLALIPVAVAAYALMALVWPWSVADPLNPLRAVGYFSAFFEKPWRELYDGAALLVSDMPRTYVPKMFALKLPEMFMALAVAGAACAIVEIARRSTHAPRRAALAMVVAAALLPIVIAVIGRPAAYNGIRHFVFLAPPLAVLGALGAQQMLRLAARLGVPALFGTVALFAAGMALPAVGMARIHPYEYTYFNGIAGGVAGAQSRYMLDYWGLSFKQAGAALRQALAARGQAPPPGRPWKIAVCGPHPPAQVALGAHFTPTWEPAGADFAMTLAAFYCARLDAPLIAEIRRAGVTYARVYDIRGRAIKTLFTLAPVERDE